MRIDLLVDLVYFSVSHLDSWIFRTFKDAMRCLIHVLLQIPNVLLWFGGKLFICAVLFVDECSMRSDV